jgi:hypothetical protein
MHAEGPISQPQKVKACLVSQRIVRSQTDEQLFRADFGRRDIRGVGPKLAAGEGHVDGCGLQRHAERRQPHPLQSPVQREA